MPREWSEWHGGACPVRVGTRVDVRHRDGGEYNNVVSGPVGYARRWEHCNAPDDIVAWRLAEDDLYAQLVTHTVTAQTALVEPPPPTKEYVMDFNKTLLEIAKEQAYLPFDKFEALLAELTKQDVIPHIICWESPLTRVYTKCYWAWIGKETAQEIIDLIDHPNIKVIDSGLQFYIPAEWKYLQAWQQAVSCMLSRRSVELGWDARRMLDITKEHLDDLVDPILGVHLSHVRNLQHPEELPDAVSRARQITDTYKPAHWPLWQLREHARLIDSTYVPLPESIAKRIPQAVFDVEVPHMAIKGANKGKIAYTESAKKGAKDVQAVAKPGRYLRRVVKDLANDQELKEMVASLAAAADVEVKVAHNDFDAFRRIYMEGPSSCMAYGDDKFSSTYDMDDNWRHPVEAYCHPDNHISLAYVVVNDRIAARCLLNTQSKTYPSMYVSDWAPIARTILEGWLEDEGYQQADDALLGEIMARIDLKNGGVLCPYIDLGGINVDIEDDHLVVGGEYEAPHDWGYAHVNGIGPEDTEICDDCGDIYPEDELTHTHHSENICEDCLIGNYHRAITRSGYIEWVHTDCAIELPRPVTADCGTRAYYAEEDIDLSDIDMVRDIDGDVQHIDDCYETADSDYVPCDEVWDESDNATVPSHYDYILVDGNAHEIDKCFFHEDKGEWKLRDDYDLDAMISDDDISYRNVEDEEAA